MTATPEKQPTVTIHDGLKQKSITLPNYGEVKITCHDGKVKLVETTKKEQM